MNKEYMVTGKLNNSFFGMTILLALYSSVMGFNYGFTPERLYRALLMIFISYLLMSNETNEKSLWKDVFIACFLKELINIFLVRKVWYYITPDVLSMAGIIIILCACEKNTICKSTHKTIITGASLIILSKIFNMGVFLFETYFGEFVYSSNIPVYITLINIFTYLVPALFAYVNPDYICYSNEK